MEPSNSSRPPIEHDNKKANGECVQDLAVVRRPELLRAASSGQLRLLKEFLSKKHGGSAEANALAREIAVHLELEAPALYPPSVAAEGASALHVVAASGDNLGYLQVAEAICMRASQLLFACDGNGDTPLHCAVRAGNAEMASLLIRQADCCDRRKTMLRLQNKRGETALHEAVRFGHKRGKRMVEALMYHDKQLARVVARDGTSPLYLAISLHHNDIAHKLISEDKELAYSGPHGQNALHPAVLHSKSEVFLTLKLNLLFPVLKNIIMEQ